MSQTRPQPRSGLVTLLTDFGSRDTFVGVMKGVLFARAPSLRAAIDLTHEIGPQDVAAGAHHLAEAYRHFPPGTVHLGVVDPGVGTNRRAMVLCADGHLFVGPDNGLFTAAISAMGPSDGAFEIDPARFALGPLSRTFHGRDLFAPVAAALVEGLDPKAVGPPLDAPSTLARAAPRRLPSGRIGGTILRADHFGNLITDLPRSVLSTFGAKGHGQHGTLRLWAGELCLPLADTYGAVEPGEPLALWNSSDLLEVAVRNGSGLLQLGLRPGDSVELEWRP